MKNPNSPRRLSILDATIAAIKIDRQWTTATVATTLSIAKSVVLHYFGTKAALIRAACERYSTQTRDIAFEVAMWALMRHDLELASIIRKQRADERAVLEMEFDGRREALLAQALNVGLGLMRELGVKADEDAVRKLFKELVFENHARERSPETKAGVDAELSA